MKICFQGKENREKFWCRFFSAGYRAALCNLFLGKKLRPTEGENDTAIIEVEEGFSDMKNIFGNHFDMPEFYLYLANIASHRSTILLL